MAIYPTSFFVPPHSAVPFIVEDTYIRGGYHCVTDIAERDGLKLARRKPGMRVSVASTGQMFTLNVGNLNTWVEVSGSAQRDEFTEIPTAPLAQNESHDFTIATGKSAFILDTFVNIADMLVECFSTPVRNDANPYTFLSYAGHLRDDGSSILEDESTQFNRRFAIVSNLESTPNTNTYWRVTNKGATALQPTVVITYLPLEQ